MDTTLTQVTSDSAIASASTLHCMAGCKAWKWLLLLIPYHFKSYYCKSNKDVIFYSAVCNVTQDKCNYFFTFVFTWLRNTKHFKTRLSFSATHSFSSLLPWQINPLILISTCRFSSALRKPFTQAFDIRPSLTRAVMIVDRIPKKTLSSIWRQGAALLLDPKYGLTGARFHESCLVSTSPESCWSGSFTVLLGMQDFLNEYLGSHWLGSSKSRSVLKTQVLCNDQPDSYVVGENPAINNEEISCLLVLLTRVDSNEFSQTLAHKPIWCSLWFEEVCCFEWRSFWCQIEVSCKHSQLLTTCNDRSVISKVRYKAKTTEICSTYLANEMLSWL